GWASRGPRVRRVTGKAFAQAAGGSDEDLKGAVEKLDELPGVGVRMATAVLMFYDPKRFTVMDVNAWRSLVHLGFVHAFDFWFEESKDYPPFNKTCLELSRQFHHSLR